MRKEFFILIALLSVAPVFAANLTAWGDAASLTMYANTRQNVTVLNMTFYGWEMPISITALNVTFTGSGTVGNISAVRVLNKTESLLGINTTWANFTNRNTTLINFSTPLNVTAHGNQTILIVYELYNSAMSRVTVGANVTSVADVVANGTITNTTSLPANSSLVQLQHMHAGGNITPRYVDTNVTNQTFIYNITPSGVDGIRDINITLPDGFTSLVLVNVTRGGSVLIAGDYTAAVGGNTINITLVTPTTLPLVVNFTANTNATGVLWGLFNATVSGSNLTSVPTDVVNNQTNVTTKQLANVTNIRATKNSAYLNGTDYWEFNFTINITAGESTTGLLQMKMGNWTDASGVIIGLSNSTDNFATLRLTADFNTTNKVNVTSQYDSTHGVVVTANQNSPITVVLRMIIPSSVSTASSTWAATYNMIFRSVS